MTKARFEPHAALPALERVAATRRAAETELASLRQRAAARRQTLFLREIVDPGEKISRAAEWSARALSGFDQDKEAASRRNADRFAMATTALLRDIAALPDWIAPEPPQVREARHAAGLLPRFSIAFEQAAAGVRTTVVPRIAPARPHGPGHEASRLQSFQLPSAMRVMGRNAT